MGEGGKREKEKKNEKKKKKAYWNAGVPQESKDNWD